MVLLKILAEMAATAMEKTRLFDMIERDQFMRTTLTRNSEATAMHRASMICWIRYSISSCPKWKSSKRDPPEWRPQEKGLHG
jgi:hypothetical protein